MGNPKPPPKLIFALASLIGPRLSQVKTETLTLKTLTSYHVTGNVYIIVNLFLEFISPLHYVYHKKLRLKSCCFKLHNLDRNC